MTLSTGGFRQVVAFPPAPIATGWSDPCREGLAPSQEPCLSTAHDFTSTTPELKFSVHTPVTNSTAKRWRHAPKRRLTRSLRGNRSRCLSAIGCWTGSIKCGYTITASCFTATAAYGYQTQIVYVLAKDGEIIADDDAKACSLKDLICQNLMLRSHKTMGVFSA
jgi:hypothetical protein